MEITNDLFEKLDDQEKIKEESLPIITYWADVRNRFFRSKLNIALLIILVTIFLLCFIIPAVSPHPVSGIQGPGKDTVGNATNWFGTNYMGQDIFTLIFEGGKVSFLVGFSAAVTQVILGVIIGSISGYVGGKVDMIIMRFIDVLMGIPYLIIVLGLGMIMGNSIFTIIFALSIMGWLNTARLVRGQVLSLKNEDYVLASQALGVNSFYIILRHLLPNMLGLIIVSVTLAIPSSIFAEAFLSFLGMGANNVISWGTLIQDGQKNISSFPMQLIAPASVMCITMLTIQLIGDALRDALDPKLRK